MKRLTDKAFEQELTAAQLRLLAYIARLTGGAADSEDILQDVNLRLWQQRAVFRAGESFLAWASSVAYYQVLAWRKAQARSRLVFSDEAVALAASRMAEDLPEGNERLIYLEQCRQGLNDKMRQLLDWHYADGESLDVIGKRLGRTPHSVANTLFFLRNALRACVEGKMKGKDR